jgi:hypothetical protein
MESALPILRKCWSSLRVTSNNYETWLWDGVTWRSAQDPRSPSYLSGLAYDKKRQRVLGFTGGSLMEWGGEGQGWHLLYQGPGGPMAQPHEVEYDPVRDRLVVLWNRLLHSWSLD